MKILAKYHGRVNKMGDYLEAPTFVTLKNVSTGETVDTDVVTGKLLEKGIDHNGCEFEVIIQESDDGKPIGIITKIDSTPISEDRLKEIKQELGDFCI